MVWIRLAVRVLLSGFDPHDTERAFQWLDHGQWEAVARLRAGEPYACVASAGFTTAHLQVSRSVFEVGSVCCRAALWPS